MAKIDKSNLTKEQARQLMGQRRLEKLSKVELDVSAPKQDTKYKVLCLKHGEKYSAEYVNKLYNMIRRHCTLDYEFVCLTDNSADIDPRVKIIKLPGGIEGWWCKPYMFSKDLPLNGTILYIDLDVVISNNIDKLFTYQPNQWCTVRDFTRTMRPNWNKYNSSVVRFNHGQLPYVWDEFTKNQKEIQRRLHGDQDWLYEATTSKPAVLYPDSWIQSWKWEIRKSKEFAPGGVRGDRKFKYIENVSPKEDCCIAVFHGDPNPHNCEDPWVVDNWR